MLIRVYLNLLAILNYTFIRSSISYYLSQRNLILGLFFEFKTGIFAQNFGSENEL